MASDEEILGFQTPSYPLHLQNDICQRRDLLEIQFSGLRCILNIRIVVVAQLRDLGRVSDKASDGRGKPDTFGHFCQCCGCDLTVNSNVWLSRTYRSNIEHFFDVEKAMRQMGAC